MSDLYNKLGKTDIYLLDQILKGRYEKGCRILDAGCGSGRNMHWFIQNNYDIYGVDINENVIADLKMKHPTYSSSISCSPLSHLPYPPAFFDHIICNAVLHFAENHEHFEKMLKELLRCLKSEGTLFIRMTSDIGIENLVSKTDSGICDIPDGSIRYLVTRDSIDYFTRKFNLQFVEALKTVNVNDQRCMTTLVLSKTN